MRNRILQSLQGGSDEDHDSHSTSIRKELNLKTAENDTPQETLSKSTKDLHATQSTPTPSARTLEETKAKTKALKAENRALKAELA